MRSLCCINLANLSILPRMHVMCMHDAAHWEYCSVSDFVTLHWWALCWSTHKASRCSKLFWCFTLPAWSTGSWAGFSSYRILLQTSSMYGLLLRQKRYRLIWTIPRFPSVFKLWISQIGWQPNFWVVADLMTNTSICVFAGSECK